MVLFVLIFVFGFYLVFSIESNRYEVKHLWKSHASLVSRIDDSKEKKSDDDGE